MTIPFIGREQELNTLRQLLRKRIASLVVLKGRRRIGKSRLCEEFAKDKRSITLTGLPPTPQTTAQAQRSYFALQMSKQLDIQVPEDKDWAELFWTLAHHCAKGPVILVFDEITWLGGKDPTFLGKLKTAWDTHFKKNSQLILILTGSISAWIEKNIIRNTGFVGRISLDMTLDELPLHRCNEFWGAQRSKISSAEKFKVLSVTGGIPRYLEEIIPADSAESNIKRLCFQKEGFLFDEFDKIFSDLFHSRNPVYKEILLHLSKGACSPEQIYSAVGIEKGGTASQYLLELELAGFISRDFTWNLYSGSESKLSRFRLRDNYVRFYVHYIEPNKSKIRLNRYTIHPVNWASIFGLQLENLVLRNRNLLLRALHIDPSHVIFDNPFFQRPSKSQPGCQIDYLVQTRDGSLYLAEIKFSQKKIGVGVIEELEQKIDRLKRPKYCSVKPVLIHVNGVSEELQAEEYFSHLIDLGDLLQHT